MVTITKKSIYMSITSWKKKQKNGQKKSSWKQDVRLTTTSF